MDIRVTKREAMEIAAEYRLPRLLALRDLPEPNTPAAYLLETAKGKFWLRLEPTKSEMDIKREFDLLLFLRKHGFPCLAPLADGRGRYYRDWNGRYLSVCRSPEGHPVAVDRLSPVQIESIGRVLGELHLVSKVYKKGVDNRFGFERVAETYSDARLRVPSYLKKIVRTLDEELEYLGRYLEGKLPKGIIHGDLAVEDVRFRGDKIVSVNGFDGAARGKYIFDLANLVNSLGFENGRYQHRRFDALLLGYEGVRTLSLAEWDAFPNELRFSAFRLTVGKLLDFFLYPQERERLNREFQEAYDRLLILRRERDGGMEPILMAMATGYDYRKYQRVKSVEKRSRG